MNDFDRWQARNEADLVERLAWLRSQFEMLIDSQITDPRLDNCSESASQSPADVNSSTDAALEILRRRFGLSHFEHDVLLLCAAMEFDTRLAGLCAKAQGDASRSYPTFSLAMTLLPEPSWEAMSPQRPLRRLRLIEIHQPRATPLIVSALRADERIVNFIKGLNQVDDRLTPWLLPHDPMDRCTLPPSQQVHIAHLQRELAAVEPGGHLPRVQLIGADNSSKQAVARQLADDLGVQLLRISAAALPSDHSEAARFAALWEREQQLLPLALYIDTAELENLPSDRSWSALEWFLSHAAGLIFLDVREVRPVVAVNTLCIDVDKPSPAEQYQQWSARLDDDAETASRLAGQFNLSTAQIERVATTAPHDCQSLWNACRGATRPRLDALAQRIDVRAAWDQLVLPPDELDQLQAIAAQVRQRARVYDEWGFRARLNRGLGISVLFAGDSGTGKTMAAEVLANELQLDLYRIDLSAVVNKYIGETEKNLRKLFDAADDGGAILLFDEADSLFGKRTDVKDSHDRYANIETNYLLQRMEAYRGLAILATNLKQAIDKAFLRRLRFVVDFPVPKVAERRALWRKAFPRDTPLGELDYEHLARLSVTGGNIHTIALNAAFASANQGARVTMSQVLEAARVEYRKLHKPQSTSEFQWTHAAGINS